MFDREMSEENQNKLKVILRLPESAELPEAVVKAYWRAKIACDRLNMRGGDLILVMVALVAGEIPEEDLPTIIELVRAKKVKRGDEVRAIWRGGQHYGSFMGLVGSSEVLVQISGEERRIDAKKVFMTDRKPELAEV